MPGIDLFSAIAEHTQMDCFELSASDIAESLEGARDVGKYWIFEHVAHVPETSVLRFTGLADMETYLCSESGPLNAFCTYAVAVVDGAVREYRLVDDRCSRVVVFNKRAQLSLKNPFAWEHRQWRVEWKSA